MEPISYRESLRILQEMIGRLRPTTEKVRAREALGRVLAAPVHASYPNPSVAVAAMDGIAVNALMIPDALVRLRPDQWQSINTGEVLPEHFNAVVRIEEVQWEETVPVLDKKPGLYQNVRRPGEDFERGALLLASEQRLLPQDISLLLAAGANPVEVYRKPVISFIPTGSELVLSLEPKQPGKILESNSAMVAGLVQNWGGEFRLMDLVPDDLEDLAQVLKVCAPKSDIVVVSAGTSKGTKDLTAEVVRYIGLIHFHGVQITPGKPVLLGETAGTPVLGLPGYPAAAYICSHLYLRPLINELTHIRPESPRAILISSEDIAPKRQDSFYRVNCFEVDGQTFVRRIEGGASSIASISRMDGWMHVPPETTIKKRDGVRIELIQDRAQNTTTVRGVYDPSLTHLFGLVRRHLPSHRLLFWESSGSDALQTIVDRSLHVATISIPAQGQDPVEPFSRQLQEPMHRYRAFTRTMAIVFRDPMQQQLSKGMKIAVADPQLSLLKGLLEQQGFAPDDFHVLSAGINHKNMVDALPSSKWDAVFADIRFLAEESRPFFSIREHLDLVIPESFTELAAIRKLIELLLSEEFWMFIETQKGCDVAHRGLVQRAG